MAFDPTLPLANSNVTSAELRQQFTGLKTLIDAVTPPPAETDPVFAASEAAQFAPGDKAKLDTALQSEADPVFAASEAAQFVSGDKAKLDAALANPTPPAIDLANRRLIASDGATVVLNWSNGAALAGGLAVGQSTIANDIGAPTSLIIDNGGGCRLSMQGGNGIIVTGNIAFATSWIGDNTAGGGSGLGVLSISPNSRQLFAADGTTVGAGWADGTLRDGAGNAFSTGAYSPANPGHWAGSPPATLAEALDRLAAVVSNNGATPIP